MVATLQSTSSLPKPQVGTDTTKQTLWLSNRLDLRIFGVLSGGITEWSSKAIYNHNLAQQQNKTFFSLFLVWFFSPPQPDQFLRTPEFQDVSLISFIKIWRR